MNSPVSVWRQHKNLHTYLHKTGRLLVWTKIYAAQSGFEYEAPYIVGIVEFEDATRMPLQIVDVGEEHLKLNQKVVVVIRKIGKAKPEDVIEYGMKAACVW